MHDNSKPTQGSDSTWTWMITFGMSNAILSTATKTLRKTEFIPGRDPSTVQIRQPLEVTEQPELYSVFAPEVRSMLADSSHPLYSRSESLSYRRWERIPLAAKNVLKKKKKSFIRVLSLPWTPQSDWFGLSQRLMGSFILSKWGGISVYGSFHLLINNLCVELSCLGAWAADNLSLVV